MEDSLRRWWFGTSNCTIGTNVFSTSQPKTLWQDECTNLFRSVSKILKAGRIISSCLCNLNIFRWCWYDDHGEDRAGRSRGLDVSTFGPLATFGTRCLATLMMIMLMRIMVIMVIIIMITMFMLTMTRIALTTFDTCCLATPWWLSWGCSWPCWSWSL